jgi:glycerate-2-kinase
MSYLELLKLAAPETILVLTMLVVLGADLVALREVSLRFRRIIGGMMACVGCAAAVVWLVISPVHGDAFGPLAACWWRTRSRNSSRSRCWR